MEITRKNLLFALLASSALAATFTVRAQDDFLPVEEAFEFKVEPVSDKSIHLHWSMPSGYLLYRDRLHARIANPDIRMKDPVLPTAESHNDEFFGPQWIYRHDIEVVVPFVCLPSAQGPIVLQVSYQGCAEAGLCYPVQMQTLTLDLPDGLCSR